MCSFRERVFKIALICLLVLAVFGHAADLINENIQSWTKRSSGDWTQAISAGTVSMTKSAVTPDASASGSGSKGRVELAVGATLIGGEGILELPELPTCGTITLNISTGNADDELQWWDGSSWQKLTNIKYSNVTTFSHTINNAVPTRLRIQGHQAFLWIGTKSYIHDIIVTDYIIAPPATYSATAGGVYHVDLSWTKNASNQDVMVVYNTTGVFSEPTQQTIYSVGNSVAGGTVIYKGGGTNFKHENLLPDTYYYYKFFSIDNKNQYSVQVSSTSAKTYKLQPSSHATSFTASTTSANSIFVEWVDSYGAVLPDGYLIKASPVGYSSITAPLDGTPESDALLVKNVAPGQEVLTFSSLDPNTTYYFKIWPYTNSGIFIDYKTDGSVPQSSDKTYKAEPSKHVSEFTAEETGFSSIQLSWEDSDGSYLPDAYLIKASAVGYSSITAPQDGVPESDALLVKNLAYGLETVSFSGLDGNTRYYFKIWPYSNSGSLIDYKTNENVPESSARTLREEPSSHATSFTASSTSANSIFVEWVDSYGAVLPDGYLIKASPVGYSSITAPVDGTPESDALLVKNVPHGGQMPTFSGLDPHTTYYFKIWPYTNAGIFIDYKTDGSVPQSSDKTYKAEPSSHVSALEAIVGTTSSIQLSWTDAGGSYLPDAYLIKASAVSYESIADPVDGTPETDALLVKNVVHGVETITFNSLNQDTRYYFKIWPYSNSGSLIDYKTAGQVPSANEKTHKIEPSEHVSDFQAQTVCSQCIRVLWTDSGGSIKPDGYLIKASPVGYTSITAPVDGVPETDAQLVKNATFGSTIISFNGLDADITYYFKIWPYSNSGAAIDYKTSGSIPEDNAITLKVEPSNHAVNFRASATGANSITVQWNDAPGPIIPCGYVIKASSVGFGDIAAPLDSVSEANSLLVKNVVFGVQTATFDGLDDNTIYYFKIWPHSNFGHDINYKLDGTTPTDTAKTYRAEPDYHATGFQVSAVNTSKINVEWTDVSSGILPDAYLIKASAISYGDISAPQDGVQESDALLVKNVLQGTETLDFNGLEQDTRYYFKIWPYSISGSFFNYKTNGTVPTDNAKTYKVEPSEHVTALQAESTHTDVIELTWTDAAGSVRPDGYLIKGSLDGFEDISAPVDGVIQSDAPLTQYVPYGVETATFSGLDQDELYYFKIWPYSNSDSHIDYKTDGNIPEISQKTLKVEPPNHVISLTATTTGPFSIKVQWINPLITIKTVTPDGHLVKASPISYEDIMAPVDNIPEANSLLVKNVPYGSTQVIFDGLDEITTYYFKIWPYSNSGTYINYKTDGKIPCDSATTPQSYPDLSLAIAVVPQITPSPGDTMTYTILVLNEGTGKATDVVISNDIPAHTNYVSGSMMLGSIALTDAEDSDPGTFMSDSLRFIIPEIDADSTKTLRYKLVIIK